MSALYFSLSTTQNALHPNTPSYYTYLQQILDFTFAKLCSSEDPFTVQTDLYARDPWKAKSSIQVHYTVCHIFEI